MFEITIGNTKFQVVTLDLPHPELLSHSFRLRTNGYDLAAFRQIFLQREYDFSFSFEPRTIVDAGANIGCAAVWFKQKYPGATIICLEPALDNFEVLAANTRHFSNIRLLRAALWDRTMEVRLLTQDLSKQTPLHADCYQVASSGDQAVPGSYPVPAFSLGAIFHMQGLTELDILKIDIEGAEIEVLSERNDEFLANTRAVIVEPHDRFRPGCTAASEAAARRHGFRISSQGEYLYLTRAAGDEIWQAESPNWFGSMVGIR